MTLSRREFVTAAAAGALVSAVPLAARARKAPVSAAAAPLDLRAIIQRGLDAARSAGATYADVRIERLRRQAFRSREDHLVSATDDESYGLGVRVVVDGVWGFAATCAVNGESVTQAAARAVAVARGNRVAMGKPLSLAPVKTVEGTWRSPMERDPFEIELGEKAAALLKAANAALAVKGARLKVDGSLHFVKQEKTYGSTDGSFIEQTFVRSAPEVHVTAIDSARGEFETAATDIAARQIGYECLDGDALVKNAVATAERAVRRLRAKPVDPGTYDLVIAPSNLWLTIHESIGHPTELDRALGYEANYAGTSFATPEQLGKLKYGSDIVNVVADRTQKHALASCGWDDDGDSADKWDLVKRGVLVGFQTTRDQAAWLGDARGHATSFAESWAAVPFQRMPNVSLQPGTKRLTPAELIADTKRGILIEGNGSWSIDQQRYNFQFGGQSFTRIENGKLTDPLRYVAYQSNSVDFWRACDAICDERDYQLGGAMNDGKGEPSQSNPVSHGCSTSRFRGIRVLNVRA